MLIEHETFNTMYFYTEEEFKIYEADYQINDSYRLIAIYDDYPNDFLLFWDNTDISDEDITEKYHISPQKYTLNSFLPVDRNLWQFRNKYSSYYILLEDYIRKSMKEQSEREEGEKLSKIIQEIESMSSKEMQNYFIQFPNHKKLWIDYNNTIDAMYDDI